MKFLFLVLPAFLVLVACVEKKEPIVTYDQNSWETMIEDSCRSYFDGCNNCLRSNDSNLSACTKKFCQHYEEPRCLDEE